ncbi:MAG: glycosyltransferase family 4 protein [Thermoplasmata archaeon]
MELCKLPGVKYSVLVPDVASPADRSFFKTERFPRSRLPPIPKNMHVLYLKSRLIYFSKSNLSLGGFFQFSAQYPGIIKKLKPDLIFENPYTTLTPRSYQTYFAAKANGIPMIYVDPGDIPPKGVLKSALSKVEGPVLRNARHIIVYNEMGKERFMREYGIPDEGISVLPKPVDTVQFTPGKGREETRARLGIGDRFTVAYVGRLSANKGAPYLLRAAAKLCESGMGKDMFFLFAGGNIGKKDTEEIKSLHQRLELDNVHFTGRVPQADIAAYQAAADIVVYPDVTNLPGFSTVLAESMAMGKAIIIGIKGFEKAVPLTHMHDAVVVNAQNEKALAENISALRDDEGLRKKLGENARRFAEERMGWDVQAKQYYKLFEAAIK